MVKSCKCRHCNITAEELFYTTNKSMCKKCISCEKKIRQKTAKSDDADLENFCEITGKNFHDICQQSQERSNNLKNTVFDDVSDTNIDVGKLDEAIKRNYGRIKTNHVELDDKYQNLLEEHGELKKNLSEYKTETDKKINLLENAMDGNAKSLETLI